MRAESSRMDRVKVVEPVNPPIDVPPENPS